MKLSHHALRTKILSRPPPSTYHETFSSYQRVWDEYKTCFPQHVEILDLAWYSHNHVNYLLACTNLGHVVAWKVMSTSFEDDQQGQAIAADDDNDNDNDDDNDNKNEHCVAASKLTEQQNHRIPVCKRKVSSKSVTSIQPLSETSPWILVTGEDGILMLHFENDFLKKTEPSPNPIGWDWWPSANALMIQRARVFQEYVYGVSPSGLAFKYNLENRQRVASYEDATISNSTKSLRCEPTKTSFPTSATLGFVDSTSPLLLIGTNGSNAISIWDVNKDRRVDSLLALDSPSTTGTNPPWGNQRGIQRLLKNSNVTAINISEHWWTIGGYQVANQPTMGGYLCTYHGPTRSLVASVRTRECIQQVQWVPYGQNGLITVGNEPVLSVWDSPYSLQRTHRIFTNAPSGHAIAISSSSDSNSPSRDSLIAVGGVGPHVDLLQHFCKIETLHLDETR